MRSLGSVGAPSPCMNYTEFVCVYFQNFEVGLCGVAREVITSVSIYCADCEK